MAIEVMNRRENKFLIDTKTAGCLMDKLSDYMVPDAYNKDNKPYIISNIYYDTSDNYLIRASNQKPKYKEKIRLRSYGMPNDMDKVYLEIKKKAGGIVNKRRTSLELSEAYNFLITKKQPEFKEYMNKQVLNELEFMLKRYDIRPKLYLAYDRIAYFDDSDLRLTIDSGIRTRRHDLKLEKGDYGEYLIDSDMRLMEIKVKNSIPLWLTSLLSEYKIYKTSFSKYGTEYRNFVKNNKEEGVEQKCCNQFLILPKMQQQPQQSVLAAY